MVLVKKINPKGDYELFRNKLSTFTEKKLWIVLSKQFVYSTFQNIPRLTYVNWFAILNLSLTKLCLQPLTTATCHWLETFPLTPIPYSLQDWSTKTALPNFQSIRTYISKLSNPRLFPIFTQDQRSLTPAIYTTDSHLLHQWESQPKRSFINLNWVHLLNGIRLIFPTQTNNALLNNTSKDHLSQAQWDPSSSKWQGSVSSKYQTHLHYPMQIRFDLLHQIIREQHAIHIRIQTFLVGPLFCNHLSELPSIIITK
jgi:hypothetical protein